MAEPDVILQPSLVTEVYKPFCKDGRSCGNLWAQITNQSGPEKVTLKKNAAKTMKKNSIFQQQK